MWMEWDTDSDAVIVWVNVNAMGYWQWCVIVWVNVNGMGYWQWCHASLGQCEWNVILTVMPWYSDSLAQCEWKGSGTGVELGHGLGTGKLVTRLGPGRPPLGIKVTDTSLDQWRDESGGNSCCHFVSVNHQSWEMRHPITKARLF